jgi:hypothetical protein
VTDSWHLIIIAIRSAIIREIIPDPSMDRGDIVDPDPAVPDRIVGRDPILVEYRRNQNA